MKPAREHATNNAQTYFVTSDTWERRALFHTESWARLFFKVLLLHRPDAYFLHEFVLMPDHFHLLITPMTSLERAVQLIKGGFSYQVKKELGSNMEIWRRGFADHRIRDAEDYDKHVHYVHLNPVKKHLCACPAEYRFSSAYPGWKLDHIPQGLKPSDLIGAVSGTAKAVPFQSGDKPGLKPKEIVGTSIGTAKAVPFQSGDKPGLKPKEIVGTSIGTAKAVPFQSNSAKRPQGIACATLKKSQEVAQIYATQK